MKKDLKSRRRSFTRKATTLMKKETDLTWFSSKQMGLQRRFWTITKHLFDIKVHTGLHSETYSTIPFRFYLKAYTDIGYTYNENNFKQNNLSNKILYTGGIGLDIVSIYDVVLRLEFSINQLNQKGLFVHAND